VDDAHAAAADLLQQLVVAEGHGGLRPRAAGRLHGELPQGGGQAPDLVLVGEELAEVRGEVRVAPQEFPPVRRPPRRHALEGVRRPPGPAAPRTRRSWCCRVASPPHAPPPSSSRNFRIPRRSSPPTAWALRPIRRPTSSTECPCRCISSTAVRWSGGSRASASARPSTSSWRL